ncbi:hypothetical protein V491_07243 [Pseudogymnoascus sp. VKM F-3775]|nr:hypothetical protein V491_07243 [Pseudogymnoascus sp. VKM F-3775]
MSNLKIPELIRVGFEAQRELLHIDIRVVAYYHIAQNCLEQRLRDPLYDVLLMIVLTFASSTVTPALPMRGSHFVVGPQKDPRFLAATLATRMLWFLHSQDFPWYEDDDTVLGVPEMMKKMGFNFDLSTGRNLCRAAKQHRQNRFTIFIRPGVFCNLGEGVLLTWDSNYTLGPMEPSPPFPFRAPLEGPDRKRRKVNSELPTGELSA